MKNTHTHTHILPSCLPLSVLLFQLTRSYTFIILVSSQCGFCASFFNHTVWLNLHWTLVSSSHCCKPAPPHLTFAHSDSCVCVTNKSGLPGWECWGSLWQRQPQARWSDWGGWDPSAPTVSYVWTNPARMRQSQPHPQPQREKQQLLQVSLGNKAHKVLCVSVFSVLLWFLIPSCLLLLYCAFIIFSCFYLQTLALIGGIWKKGLLAVALPFPAFLIDRINKALLLILCFS